jgi:hypothetical protein
VSLAVLVLVLASCAPVRVNSYVGRDADLHRYRTYAWAPADAVSTGDARLDNNTFFSDRVRQAVDARLRDRGFEKVSGQPDLLVHYHARVQQRIEAREIHPGDTDCNPRDCGPSVFDSGTLLIDLIEAQSNRLMWRGWAERSLEGVVDDQAWMEATIDDAVTRIMARLPQ